MMTLLVANSSENDRDEPTVIFVFLWLLECQEEITLVGAAIGQAADRRDHAGDLSAAFNNPDAVYGRRCHLEICIAVTQLRL